MPGRTAKQCRDRWFHHLDPSISKDPFTAEEDKTILSLFEMYGSKWSKMAELLPGRSDVSIKIRHKAIKRRLDKGI